MAEFVNASVMIPAVNETYSLKKTVETVCSGCKNGDLKEIIITVCEKTTDECLAVAKSFNGTCSGTTVRILRQTLPGIGGAIRDSIDASEGSHTILMPADEGIDLDAPARMIALAKEHPDAIISTSRWMENRSFHGYDKIKLILNYMAQIFLRILFNSRLTDLTNPSQIAPVELYASIKWDSTDYNFMPEMVLKPLRLGIEIIEIPTSCHERREGKSGNSPLKTFAYLKTALKIRFCRRSSLLNH